MVCFLPARFDVSSVTERQSFVRAQFDSHYKGREPSANTGATSSQKKGCFISLCSCVCVLASVTASTLVFHCTRVCAWFGYAWVSTVPTRVEKAVASLLHHWCKTAAFKN